MKCRTYLEDAGRYFEPTDKRFAHLEIKGGYREISYQIGRVFRRNIEEIISRRSEWHSGLINIINLGSASGWESAAACTYHPRRKREGFHSSKRSL